MTDVAPHWTCPECRGAVRQEGPNERVPIRCEACGTRYRHPRLPMLLSLALPGLGSIVEGRRLWGVAVFAFGTGAFLGAAWKIFRHLRVVLAGGSADLEGLVLDAGVGTVLVVIAYCLDLLVIWLRRDHLGKV